MHPPIVLDTLSTLIRTEDSGNVQDTHIDDCTPDFDPDECSSSHTTGRSSPCSTDTPIPLSSTASAIIYSSTGSSISTHATKQKKKGVKRNHDGHLKRSREEQTKDKMDSVMENLKEMKELDSSLLVQLEERKKRG